MLSSFGSEGTRFPSPVPRLTFLSPLDYIMPFAIDEAHLVSLFSESVFYGLFLATFIACLRAILWNGASFHAAAHVRWALLVVACTMFVVATLDISFNLEHDLNAFIRYKGPGGPSGEFSKISNWINLARVRAHHAVVVVEPAG